MTEQHTLPWERGQSAAPLPPLVDLSDVAQEEQPLVSLYRTYGPVFRFPQPGQAPQIILAGPEINVFLARHEDAFFTTAEQWEQFRCHDQPKAQKWDDRSTRWRGQPQASSTEQSSLVSCSSPGSDPAKAIPHRLALAGLGLACAYKRPFLYM